MKCRYILTLIGLLTFSWTYGQRELNNTKTDKHQHVEGSNFFLIPPPGFVEASNFQGFQQESSGASIMVLDMPGPFAESTKGFTEEGLKSQGVKLIKKEEVNVNGYQGLFVTAEQLAYGVNYAKYILVFGDEQNTFMVNGAYPKNVPGLKEDMLEAIYSIVYEPDMVVDQLNSVPFVLVTEGTKLKLAKNMGGSLLYTVDGKIPTASADKTSFVAGLSISNVQTPDRKFTSIARIKQLPYSSLVIDEDQITEIEIDGISGYEIHGEGVHKSSGAKELVYQAMLFDSNGYYIMVGTTRSDFAENLDLFKQVARTFKRK
ncbi:MAG: hypothetical protein IPL92_11285 [Saprospiraceae bacterium]|nr:hypothetical protein [Candidatus Opimibacter iunctus]